MGCNGTPAQLFNKILKKQTGELWGSCSVGGYPTWIKLGKLASFLWPLFQIGIPREISAHYKNMAFTVLLHGISFPPNSRTCSKTLHVFFQLTRQDNPACHLSILALHFIQMSCCLNLAASSCYSVAFSTWKGMSTPAKIIPHRASNGAYRDVAGSLNSHYVL